MHPNWKRASDVGRNAPIPPTALAASLPPPPPLTVESLGRLPAVQVGGTEVSVLHDIFNIDDWRTCRGCDAHTPHSGDTCLCCNERACQAR